MRLVISNFSASKFQTYCTSTASYVFFFCLDSHISIDKWLVSMTLSLSFQNKSDLKDKRIEVKIETIMGDIDVEGCVKAVVEIKTNGDQRLTGPRYIFHFA